MDWPRPARVALGFRRLGPLALLLVCLTVACSHGVKRSSQLRELPALSTRAAAVLRDAARELGQKNLDATDASLDAIGRYVDTVAGVGEIFGGPGLVDGRIDARKEPSAFVVAGMNLTLADIMRNLPGGPLFQDADARQAMDRLMPRTELERFQGARDRLGSLKDQLRIAMLYSLFTDENLARMLVPPGSPVANTLAKAGFIDEQGRVRVPVPGAFGVDIVALNRFNDALAHSYVDQLNLQRRLRGL